MSQISQEKIFKNMYLEEHLRSSASVKMLLNCEITMAIFRVNLKFKWSISGETKIKLKRSSSGLKSG